MEKIVILSGDQCHMKIAWDETPSTSIKSKNGTISGTNLVYSACFNSCTYCYRFPAGNSCYVAGCRDGVCVSEIGS